MPPSHHNGKPRVLLRGGPGPAGPRHPRRGGRGRLPSRLQRRGQNDPGGEPPGLPGPDEPTTGLDPVSKARLHDLVLARVDDDATIVMTTHDLAEAERLASRVLIMNEGRIIADGTVIALRELLDRGSEITWIEGGARHVHTTHSPERFVRGLDLDAVTGLTITRPTLEETYLSLVNKEPRP